MTSFPYRRGRAGKIVGLLFYEAKRKPRSRPRRLDTILASAAYQNGGVIFLTWDEAEGHNGDSSDQVPMIGNAALFELDEPTLGREGGLVLFAVVIESNLEADGAARFRLLFCAVHFRFWVFLFERRADGGR